ncbi:hypothetical protein NE462_27695, partial [Blautia hominis]|nr:hypothetical protein [Blautia hominis]
AGKMKKIFHVTIPAIVPTIVTMLILKLGGIIKVGYEAILLLSSFLPSSHSFASRQSGQIQRSGPPHCPENTCHGTL